MTCVSNPAHAARRLELPVLQAQYLVSLLWNWIDQAFISWVLLYCAGNSLDLVINTLSIKSHIPSICSPVCNRESPTFFVKT